MFLKRNVSRLFITWKSLLGKLQVLRILFIWWLGRGYIMLEVQSASQSGSSSPLSGLVILLLLFSRVQLFATPWTAAHQASLSFTISWSLLKLMSIESVMPFNHLSLCHPLLLSPSIFPSIRVFSNESVLRIRWLKYWSFSFNISPFSEYSGLISFRIDWFDHFAIQGTLKSLLQHHSSKTSILLSQLSFWSSSHIHAWLLEKP